MLKKGFARLIERVLLIATLVFFLFANFSYANNEISGLGYDSRWVKVGSDWKVLNSDGTYLSNCWFFDTVQLRWYRIGSLDDEIMTGSTGHFNAKDTSSMIAGLWTEKNTNKSYFFDNFSSLTYGSLIDKNGYYTINGKSIYLEFEQSDANTKGAITFGLSELKTALANTNEVVAPKAESGGSSGGGSESGGGSVKPVIPKVKRTFLFYIIGSDLEENSLSATKDIYEIAEPNYPSDIRVLIFTGGSRMELVETARKNNKEKKIEKYFVINWDKNQIWEARKGIHPIEEDLGSESMTDEKTLSSFLNYVKKYYPSEEYNIVFNDHGAGAYEGIGDDKRKNIKKTTSLSLIETKNAFDSAGLKFGFIGFDACLMGNIEYLYGLSDYANYYIGSSELETGSWDYDPFEALVKNPKLSNEDLLKKIIDNFIGLKNRETNTLALFNLKNFKADVEGSLSKFAKNIYDVSLKDFSSLKELVRARSKSIEYGVNENYDFVDLYDFTENINNSSLSDDLKSDATNLFNAVNSHIIYYGTNRPKDGEGKNRTCGLSIYFPLLCLDMDTSDNNLLSFYKTVGNTYVSACDEMLRAVYIRMMLANTIVKSSKYTDDETIKKLDNEVLNVAKKILGLTDGEISKIKTNVYPDLLRYRLFNHNTSNFSFEKSGRVGELIFKYKDYLVYYLDDVYAEPMTYDENGQELRLGHVTIPHTSYEEGDDIVWNIAPREGYWFTMTDNAENTIVSFYPTEIELVNSDYASENYLFDNTITGYIPAVKIVKDKDGSESEEPILVYARFEELNNTAEILGYSYYNIDDKYEPSKEIHNFENNEKIKPIFNFEDAKNTKIIKNKGKLLDTNSLNVNRGSVTNDSIYYSYYILDAFNQKTQISIDKRVTFKDTPNEIQFSMPEYETWTYTYKAEDNSINILSEVDGSQENMSLIVSTVPSGNSIYNDFRSSNKKFSDETINYFRQRDFDNIATSSISIKQEEYAVDLLSSLYSLRMKAVKNIEGTDCTYLKLYYVFPKGTSVLYLFDVTLYSPDISEICNENIMLYYVFKMLEHRYKNFSSDIEITIRPLVVNQMHTASDLTGNAEIVRLATILDLDEQIATESELIEETTSDSDEQIATESEASETIEDVTSEIEESTSATEETTIEMTETASETEETEVETEETTIEEESTAETEESINETEETASEEEESTSETEETTSEAVEATIEMIESDSEAEEETSESIEQTTEKIIGTTGTKE